MKAFEIQRGDTVFFRRGNLPKPYAVTGIGRKYYYHTAYEPASVPIHSKNISIEEDGTRNVYVDTHYVTKKVPMEIPMLKTVLYFGDVRPPMCVDPGVELDGRHNHEQSPRKVPTRR